MRPTLLLLALAAWAGASPGAIFDSSSVARAQSNERERRDFIARSLKYDTGTVVLGGDLATLRLPQGFRYLDPADADRMLSGLWGNIPGEVTLGLIVPAGVDVTLDQAWVILLRNDTLGHVDDSKGLPAPEALMKSYQEVEETRNEDRMGANNPRKDILAWVVPPSYDSSVRTLHWAVDTRGAWFDGKDFREVSRQTEYNVRVLGRRGAIRMEPLGAVGGWRDLQASMTPLLASVDFNPGFRHADFDPKLDRASGQDLQDLVTGLPLRFPGGFAVWAVETVLDYGEIALIGLALLIGFAVRFFRRTIRRRSQEAKVVEDVAKRVE